MEFDPHEEVVGQVGALRALREAGSRTVFVHGGRRLAADECLQTVYQITRVLQAAGIGPGNGIGMLSLNLPEAFLVQVACQVVGARYTPLHPMGSLDDHKFVAADAEIRCFIYDPRLFSERAAQLRSSGMLHLTFALGEDDGNPDLMAAAALASGDPVEPEPVRGSDIETLYYTGGTTGRPKGVMHTRFGTWYTQLALAGDPDHAHRTRELRMLICTPISHAGGTAITPTLMRGGTVVLVDKFDAGEFLEIIEREQITETFVVPTMVYVLLDYLREHPEIDVSSLEEVIYGAAPMSPKRLHEAIERIGPVFVQGYGQTEAGVSVLRLRKEDHRLDRPDLLASAGKPMLGVVAKILREDGTEAAVGEVGELCLRGPMVMKGYWKNPELTAQALRGGWLHTDDMGYLDAAGYVTLVDRKKDMIISGGFNVYPSEVENALAEHPAVEACAVIGVPDDKWGESVKAFVVLKGRAQASAEELIMHVRNLKGRVNAPKRVDFIDELPLTVVGKVDRKALRADR